ncbi:MAG: hypothetical protein KG028_01710 [Actinobacteria bacterium]|nr:hypothetical protein [Actinomycetota bacterium]
MSSSRRLLVTITVGIGLAVLLVAVGIYGLLTGPPPDTPQAPADEPGTAAEPEQTDRAPVVVSPRPSPGLPRTTDPLTYARAVAEALLTWDTMAVAGPAEHVRPVLADADPDRVETPGLAGDLARYLPQPDVWQQLRHHHTTQTATIHAVYIPDSWDSIATSESAGHLRDGTVAVTIEATRHRTGIWLDQPASADHPVTFTVFVACPPAFDRCHLLRLSQLDNPLP